MFKKIICMTALSLALVSSPESYSGEKCGITNLFINSSGNFTGSVDPLKCKVSKFNNPKNSYLGNENPNFRRFSIAMNVISPVVATILGIALRQIVLENCNAGCIKYIKHRSESKTRRCSWEKFLSSSLVILFIGLCSPVSIVDGLTGVLVSLIPPLVLGTLRLVTDLFYAVTYSSDWQCRKDIAHLETLINNIQETEIKSEAKYLFESLINRGKINELFANFHFDRMLDAGVQEDFLRAAINNMQDNVLRNNMIIQLNNTLQQVQANRLRDALQVVLQAPGNVLQAATEAQHNAGHDAELQTLQGTILGVLQHV